MNLVTIPVSTSTISSEKIMNTITSITTAELLLKLIFTFIGCNLSALFARSTLTKYHFDCSQYS